jgi:HAE1 family hydrophobic/amphiphilic exporter-1
MGTMTTVIVFLPASLVEGEGQFFLVRLAMPICISVVASLLVALVLVPLAVYLTLPHSNGRNGNGEQPSAFRRAHERINAVLRHSYDATMGRLNDFYERLLRRGLRRRFDVAMLLLVTLAGTFAVFGKVVEVVEQQEDEAQGFDIEVELPQDTTLEEAEEFFLRCEKIVEGKKDEYQLAGWFVFHRATFGSVEGWFAPDRDDGPTAREITAELLKLLPEKPGVRFYTGEESEQEKEQKGTFRVPLYGEDIDELEATAAAITARLSTVPGVLGVRKDGDRPSEEVALEVDRERAQRLGVSPEVVAAVVGYALRGQSLPRFSNDGEEVPVRVRFREEDRETLAQLEDFAVPGPNGEQLPLRSLTDSRFLPAPREIERSDRRTARELVFELAEGKEKEAKEGLQAALAEVDLPEGVRLGEQLRQGMPEDAKALLFAVALSIVFIYLLMAFLFESFVLPLSIVLTIPLAFLGVAWGHMVSGLDMDFLGMVGVVVLIGVVVNNGIVLIDYVNRLRLAGQEREEALVQATHRRFRPIMMTAMTTVSGMVPLLFAGSTSIGMSYTSFAVSLVGGMIVATLLTLLVVPVFYTLFDDLRAYLGKTMAWGAARRGWARRERTAAG